MSDSEEADYHRERELWLAQLAQRPESLYNGPERRHSPPHESCLMTHIELIEKNADGV